MPFVRRRLQSLAWIALVAMLALALLPALSRAMSAGGVTPQGEICTVGLDGRPAPAGEAPAPSPHGASHVLDHCPLCASGAAPIAPPPAAPAFAAVDRAGFVAPLFGQAPRPLFAWAAARPRGPPTGC